MRKCTKSTNATEPESTMQKKTKTHKQTNKQVKKKKTFIQCDKWNRSCQSWWTIFWRLNLLFHVLSLSLFLLPSFFVLFTISLLFFVRTFHIKSDYNDKQTCYDIETSFVTTDPAEWKIHMQHCSSFSVRMHVLVFDVCFRTMTIERTNERKDNKHSTMCNVLSKPPAAEIAFE